MINAKECGMITMDRKKDFVISRGKIQSLFQLASFIDELEMVFGKNVDVITDTSNDIGFLERIKEDEVVVYEAKR